MNARPALNEPAARFAALGSRFRQTDLTTDIVEVSALPAVRRQEHGDASPPPPNTAQGEAS
jgi:hypothetical protein